MRSRDGFLSASCASLLEAFLGAGGGLIVSRSGLGLHKTIKRPCAVWRFRAGFPEGASRFPGRPAFQKDCAKSLVDGTDVPPQFRAALELDFLPETGHA